MFESIWTEITGFFTPDRFRTLIVILIVIVVGIAVIKILNTLTSRVTRRYLSQQYKMLVRKGIRYTGAVILLFIVLHLLGVKITALLGAAGIVGIAIGFAAQTSMSNLISGLFMISEKPFEIGDVIKVSGTVGVVQSIDLLSVKITTFDNQYIRIPNEKLLGSELTNVTRFPIRRMDVNLTVAYKTDINQLKSVLAEIAAANSYCLDEPAPLIVFKNFGDSALEFLLGLWFYKTDYLNLKNSIMQEIKERFDREGIEIPFPHLSLYSGSATEPMPIRIVNDAPSASGRPVSRKAPSSHRDRAGSKRPDSR
ncbi:MAG: mechanosensitive ion channel family protein [Spirochaetaceae bacterium]|nr:MAG: mechanosensitive ion channel family protein [Spirochaetaceae bacterium]